MNIQDFIINPGDAQRILIGASGKLGPKEFAQGLVFIVAASLALMILSMIPVISLLALVAYLGLAFAWVCIFSKRFHDAGQSGWMTLAAIGVAIVISALVGILLNPVFGGANYMTMGGTTATGTGFFVQQMITNVIVNGALGFYMYRLKSVLI
jgi:uncharacterized membrane protein YhaH (DUF805 family)